MQDIFYRLDVTDEKKCTTFCKDKRNDLYLLTEDKWCTYQRPCSCTCLRFVLWLITYITTKQTRFTALNPRSTEVSQHQKHTCTIHTQPTFTTTITVTAIPPDHFSPYTTSHSITWLLIASQPWPLSSLFYHCLALSTTKVNTFYKHHTSNNIYLSLRFNGHSPGDLG